MAGTGYHPEGHDIVPIPESWASDDSTFAKLGYRYTCKNCAEVARTENGFSEECIDDW